MTTVDEPIDVREVLSLATEKLERPWSGADFRLRSVIADAGELWITFWWERNPTLFGVKVALPQCTSDEVWTRWAPGSVDEWVEYAVRVTLEEELLTGLTRRAHRSHGDGVTWLDLEDRSPVPAFRIYDVEHGCSDTRALQSAGIETAEPASAKAAGRLLVWRYAVSTDTSGRILGAISVDSGDPPAVCRFDVAPGGTPEATRALLQDAVHAVADLGWLTVVAPHGPGWLTSWGFVANSAGVLTLDLASAPSLGPSD